jgi:UDP-GlcNAc:undecaprenyl-phosphate GlcNAc-1-phosphate transferase
MQILLAVVTAASTSAALIALMLWSGRSGPIDQPNHRSLHDTPVPRSGGLGILAGLLLGGAAGVMLGGPAGLPPLTWLAALAVLALISWWDDRFPLPAYLRFVVHILAASLVFADTSQATSLGGWCLLLLIPACVWVINLYNFMDGANGLAGGMAVAGFSAYAGMAWTAGHADLALWAVIIVGAALGFLCFNFDPARIFMGDAGSVSLGFLAAVLGIEGWQRGAWPLWFPLLVFSPFIVDASVTLARRALRGEKVWQAHREHYYQRLVRMGWLHRRLALSEYALMSAVAVTAVMLLAVPPVWQWVGVAAWGVIYVVLMRWIDTLWQRTHEA